LSLAVIKVNFIKNKSKMKFTPFLIIIIFLSCCSSNNPNQEENYPFEGKIENRTYINDFFSMRLPIEDVWKILNETDIQKSLDVRKELMNSLGKPFSEEEFARLEMEHLILLILTQGNNPQDMPTIMVSYQPITQNLVVKDELSYLAGYKEKVKTQYESLGMDFSFSKVEDVEINNLKFKSSLTSIKYEESFQAYQRIYCSIQGKHFLNITINYSNETELAQIENQLNQIEIK
jgi:hypothetical protein